MPIDVERALAAELPEHRMRWGPDDVILYHLALGAGAELDYAYEANLKVLPAFAVVPAMPILSGLEEHPGLDFRWTDLLHGEQELELLREAPVEADACTTGRVAAIYDKGSGALVVVEATTEAGGSPLFVNRFSLFIRGEGGFGGEPGPRRGDDAPAGSPDVEIEHRTVPQQALLYRLCGDKNPVHADPEIAARAGFERPILHGLCTYGIACKVAVDSLLGGDVSGVARYRARFAGVVFPGETIVVGGWREDDRILLRATCRERGTEALTNAAITLT